MIDSSYLELSVLSVGIAITAITADPKTPTSRTLAIIFGFIGAATLALLMRRIYPAGLARLVWTEVAALSAGAALIAGNEWNLRVARTATPGGRYGRLSEVLSRMSQASFLLFSFLAALFPRIAEDIVIEKPFNQSYTNVEAYLFFAPLVLGTILFSGHAYIISRSNIDRMEQTRLRFYYVAIPFLTSFFFVPIGIAPILIAVGEVIFLAGMVRFSLMQGERNQFLAKFLSPQVSRLVRERGLVNAMQESRVELSVVDCDLRGFTAFSQKAAPEEVTALLRQYYDVASRVVTEFGCTIKDFAGDGILILVGAPIPYQDHANRAVSLALELRKRCTEILERFRKLGLELGFGVGVASGYVTVGVLGGSDRLEYVAVGPPVNLASRLCEHAASGQVLIDQGTLGLVRDHDKRFNFEQLGSAELKGFPNAVNLFSALEFD